MIFHCYWDIGISMVLLPYPRGVFSFLFLFCALKSIYPSYLFEGVLISLSTPFNNHLIYSSKSQLSTNVIFIAECASQESIAKRNRFYFKMKKVLQAKAKQWLGSQVKFSIISKKTHLLYANS